MIYKHIRKEKGFSPALTLLLVVSTVSLVFASESKKPLVLQEMTWTDIRDYLKTCDMAIIPIGSTEQHGPHLPLGTDYYEAVGMAKMISARTGVVVAPVLMVGYSVYHSGFPGTLSLKPETLEQVLFESAEMLIKVGFRRIMFFNYHGGNRISESKAIHRINHKTEAVALRIGLGAAFQEADDKLEGILWDVHAGINETSIMLFLKPKLVKMSRAEKPTLNFTQKMKELVVLSQKSPELVAVLSTLWGVPPETRKGGASHEISSNGIWSTGDPKRSTKDLGEKLVAGMVERAVRFINTWKLAKN